MPLGDETGRLLFHIIQGRVIVGRAGFLELIQGNVIHWVQVDGIRNKWLPLWLRRRTHNWPLIQQYHRNEVVCCNFLCHQIKLQVNII